jgi:hypothetical protein
MTQSECRTGLILVSSFVIRIFFTIQSLLHSFADSGRFHYPPPHHFTENTGMSPFAIGPGPEKPTRLGFSLAVGLIALLAVAKVVLFDTLDPDCFWHLRVAQQLKTEGIGPLVDTLSFASVQTPWTPYSWLAELAMRWVWENVGWRGAVASQAMLQAVFVIFLAAACRSRSAAPRAHPGSRREGVTDPGALQAAVATLFGTVLSLPYLSFRPVTAALALLTICSWLIVRDRRWGERSRALWLVVPLTVLIVNLHLYAIFVPLWIFSLLLGAVWEWRALSSPADRPEANRRVERYAILLVLTIAACALTPMLPGLAHVAFHYQFSDVMVRGTVISEMQPFYTGVAGGIAAGLVLVFMGCVTFNHRKLRSGEVIWLLMSFLMLLRLGRFAPIFAIVAAPIAAATLPALADRLLGRTALCGAMAVVLALGGVRVFNAFPSPRGSLSDWLNRHGPDTPGYPCAAADFVDARVKPASGRLINEFSWGGYLEWRLGDRYQTLLDGRTQLFDPEFWKCTYLRQPAERQRFLAQLGADAAVLPTHNSIFHDSLAHLGWTTAYRDDRSEVMLPPPGVSPKSSDWPSASILLGN